jgi:hypothetical protein
MPPKLTVVARTGIRNSKNTHIKHISMSDRHANIKQNILTVYVTDNFG